MELGLVELVGGGVANFTEIAGVGEFLQRDVNSVSRMLPRHTESHTHTHTNTFQHMRSVSMVYIIYIYIYNHIMRGFWSVRSP